MRLRSVLLAAHLALRAAMPFALVLPAAAQSVKAPTSFVTRVNPATANVEMQDGTGQWVPFGTINPSAHSFMPAGLAAEIAARTAAQALLAPLASPVFSGLPTAPTAAPKTASGVLATTAYSDAATAAEAAIARLAEQANATNIAANATAIASETTRAQGAEGTNATAAANALTAARASLQPGNALSEIQALGTVSQATARGNISAAGAGVNSDITNLLGLQLIRAVGIAPLNTTYAAVQNPAGLAIAAPGNQVSFCPALSCISTPDVDHQRATLLLSAQTQDDAHSEEQTLAITTTINKGLLKAYAASTSYNLGDNVVVGGAVYRVTVAGTTGANSAPPGTRPTTSPFTATDGTVTFLWINDQAIAAKVGLYNETQVQAGAGQAWAQANNIQLQPGAMPSFAANLENDFVNNSGVDAAIGGPNFYGQWIKIGGSNKSTVGSYISGGNTANQTYSTFWGLRLAGQYLASLADIEDDASAPVGLGFGASGIGGSSHSTSSIQDASTGARSLYITGSHTTASIDDPSAAPSSLNVSGNKSIADITLSATSPRGIQLNGTKSSATYEDNTTSPAALNIKGTHSIAALRDASTSGYGLQLAGAYSSGQVTGSGWGVGTTGGISTTIGYTGPNVFAATTGSLLLGNVTDGASVTVLDPGGTVADSIGLKGAVAGGTPTIQPQGSDTAVGLNIASKAAAPINMITNGATSFRVDTGNSNAVNYLRTIPAVTGAGPTLSAKGTDASVDLNLAGQAAGRVVAVSPVVYTVSAAFQASGTTQATATQLVRDLTVVTGGSGGVILAANVGQRQEVFNRNASAINVYPPSGAGIESGSANTPVSLAAGGHAVFECLTSTQCYQAP